jgi:hypothetical protein
MTKAKMLLATIDTFTKQGRFVPKGQPLSSEEVDTEGSNTANLTDAPASLGEGAVIEISAIAPTGPNPTAPQQKPNDSYQTEAGFVQAGVRLVGEVTKPEKERIEIVGIDSKKAADVQADVNEKLEKAGEEQAEEEAKRREEVAAATTAEAEAARAAKPAAKRTPRASS